MPASVRRPGPVLEDARALVRGAQVARSRPLIRHRGRDRSPCADAFLGGHLPSETEQLQSGRVAVVGSADDSADTGRSARPEPHARRPGDSHGLCGGLRPGHKVRRREPRAGARARRFPYGSRSGVRPRAGCVQARRTRSGEPVVRRSPGACAGTRERNGNRNDARKCGRGRSMPGSLRPGGGVSRGELADCAWARR